MIGYTWKNGFCMNVNVIQVLLCVIPLVIGLFFWRLAWYQRIENRRSADQFNQWSYDRKTMSRANFVEKYRLYRPKKAVEDG